jgi:hypothetical protein
MPVSSQSAADLELEIQREFSDDGCAERVQKETGIQMWRAKNWIYGSSEAGLGFSAACAVFHAMGARKVLKGGIQFSIHRRSRNDVRYLVDVWDEAKRILGLSRMQAAIFVENVADELAVPVYSNVDTNGWRTGIWELCDTTTTRKVIGKLGVSNYANGSDDGREDAESVAITLEDFAKIVGHLRELAGVAAVPELRADSPTYTEELRAAIEAFDAVSADPALTAKSSPKAALFAWLEANKPELSANARERIATVANWQPAGGAPKTPG